LLNFKIDRQSNPAFLSHLKKAASRNHFDKKLDNNFDLIYKTSQEIIIFHLLIFRIMEQKQKPKEKKRTCCPVCGSKNTYESNKPKEGHYLYCNHCGYEHWDD